MKGKQIINIVSRRASYVIELERKISVIKGNSGTGKSSMIRLISEYLEFGKKSGIKLSVNTGAALRVLNNGSDWEKILSSIHDTVMFMDEDVQYLYTVGFQKALWKADCYAVIVSRSGMFTGLPFSVLGIYELMTEKKERNTATSMYQRYEAVYTAGDFNIVLTEDSNSGLEMARYAFERDGAEVLFAGGNANVLNVLTSGGIREGRLCVQVDGAAFGAYIEPVLKYAAIRKNMMVTAPESFEYVLLNYSDIKRYLSPDGGELTRTYDYCEGTLYSTWEQYYEKLLATVTSEHLGFTYTKRKMNPWFLNRKCAKQYLDTICRCFIRRRLNESKAK